MSEKNQYNEEYHPFFMDACTNFVVYRLRLGAQNIYDAEVAAYTPSARDVLGISMPQRIESWFEPLHPEDRERVTRGTIHATSTGEPFEEVFRLYHMGKKNYIWVYCKAIAEFDSQGKPVYFNGMVLDVTEFKQAVQTFQDTSQELKDLLRDLKEKIPQQEEAEEKLNTIMKTLKAKML